MEPRAATPPHDEHPAATGEPLRCLVTGGAGFIGSHLVDHLLGGGHTVTVIDNLSTGRRENLPAEHPGLSFIHADLEGALTDLEDDAPFDRVFHLAAAVGVKRIIENPIDSIETNILDTAALLRFASGHSRRGAPLPPTLVASSSEVYGKGVSSPFQESDDCLYGPTTALRWSYAASKALDEYLALAHHAEHGLPAVVVRFFNTVGPRQIGDYGMVLPNFVTRVLDARAPQVFGTGAQSRCFCDVRDITPALPTLLSTPGCHGRVFNLGSDQPISILDLARLVIDTLAGEQGVGGLEPELVPYDEAYSPGFEDLARRQPDLARVRDAIGFAPKIPIERTILDLAQHLRTDAAPSGAREGYAHP